jgi:hypothetical protein
MIYRRNQVNRLQSQNEDQKLRGAKECILDILHSFTHFDCNRNHSGGRPSNSIPSTSDGIVHGCVWARLPFEIPCSGKEHAMSPMCNILHANPAWGADTGTATRRRERILWGGRVVALVPPVPWRGAHILLHVDLLGVHIISVCHRGRCICRGCFTLPLLPIKTHAEHAT